jgi:hypothetical protein
MTASTKESCLLCEDKHPVERCKEWRIMNTRQRWSLAWEKKACFKCLGTSHQGVDCDKEQKCGKDGCEKTHHRDLHQKAREENRKENHDSKSRSRPAKKKSMTTMISESQKSTDNEGDTVALRLIPVNIIGKGGKKLAVTALMDDGSDTNG